MDRVTSVDDRILNGIVQTIVNESDPERVMLFGSRVSGAFGDDSDVDLIVAETEPFHRDRSRRREMARLWTALAQYGVAKDILVFSLDEVDRWRDSLNHVLARALRQGRVLYERP
jgi:predicted nucleotidyltransferase